MSRFDDSEGPFGFIPDEAHKSKGGMDDIGADLIGEWVEHFRDHRPHPFRVIRNGAKLLLDAISEEQEEPGLEAGDERSSGLDHHAGSALRHFPHPLRAISNAIGELSGGMGNIPIETPPSATVVELRPDRPTNLQNDSPN